MSSLQSDTVERCLSCGTNDLTPVLDLGVQPLANNLLPSRLPTGEEPRFPLGIQVCKECWLLQLTHIVPPVELFSDYVYFTSNSDAMLAHARRACELYKAEFGLNSGSFVIEIASNDGYLLKNLVRDGIPSLGVEPAENIAEVARREGIETLCKFFGSETAIEIANSRRKADLILGNNVFAHAPDTNDFVEGLSRLLADDGSIVVEFPSGKEMIDNNEFDTIYHEHVFYFHLTALVPLFARHGLEVYHVEELPIHGGSLRVWAGHLGSHRVTKEVDGMLAAEADGGISNVSYYSRLGERAESVRSDLFSLVQRLKTEGHTIAAYGASAKGSTLLNYAQIPASSIDFIADRSTTKQGMHSPGLHLPIIGPDALIRRRPDFVLLLTWNFLDEIIEQQEPYRRMGGKFIVPIPNVEII